MRGVGAMGPWMHGSGANTAVSASGRDRDHLPHIIQFTVEREIPRETLRCDVGDATGGPLIGSD